MSDSIRECGSCSACCAVLAVPELDKDTHVSCEHLCETGCGIYAERPPSCQTFRCQWLRAVLEADDGIDAGMRPDACGVIFDYQPESAFGEVYTAWEVAPGASANGPARTILEGLMERYLVILVIPGSDSEEGPVERSFLGPPHLVARASDVMWSRPAGH